MLVPIVVSVVSIAAVWSKREFFFEPCFGKNERVAMQSMFSGVLIALVCLPMVRANADDQEATKPEPAPAATPADLVPAQQPAAAPATTAADVVAAQQPAAAPAAAPAADTEKDKAAAEKPAEKAAESLAKDTPAAGTPTADTPAADTPAAESPATAKSLTNPVEAESPDKPAASPDKQSEQAQAAKPDADPKQAAEKPLAGTFNELAKSEAREPTKFITNVKYLTANRPEWLESAPVYEKDTYIVAIKAGPYRSIRECEPDLRKEAETAARDFVNQHLKSNHASTFISYSLDEMRHRNIVREQFNEKLETSMGLMNQVHAKLVFDDALRGEVDTRWAEIKSKSRLAQTGLGAGVIFLLLGTLFSYFRVDTATKGYYTGRLQFVTAGTILALVAASVLLAKWIPWM